MNYQGRFYYKEQPTHQSVFGRLTFVSILFIFVLAVIFNSPDRAAAQVITWGGGTESADTDIMTNGTTVMAYSFSGQNPTLNNVAFTGTVTATGVSPDFSLASPVAGIGNSPNYSASPGPNYASLSTAYQQLIQAGTHAANLAPMTLSISNLTVGNVYALQLWTLETRSAYYTRTMTIAGANTNTDTVTIAYNPLKIVGGVGQFAIGVFTATNAVETFTMTGAAPQVNAFQVRDVTGTGYTPPPLPVAQAVVWNGFSATDSYWSNAANWNGSNVMNNAILNSITFGGTARQINTNDLSRVNIGGVSMTTGNWDIIGNPVSLNGGFSANIAGTNIWELDMTLNVSPIITLTNNAAFLNFSGLLSGPGAIILNNSSIGSGTLALSNPTNNFTGTLTNYGGNLVYTTLAPQGQPSSLGAAASPIYVGSPGSPATMTFAGTTSVNSDRGLIMANNATSGGITLNNNSPNNSGQRAHF